MLRRRDDLWIPETYDTDSNFGTALSTLTNASRILIYCGAGVSNAETGLTWHSLLHEMTSSLLNEAKSPEDKRLAKALQAHIDRYWYAPQQNATLVAEFLDSMRTHRRLTCQTELGQLLSKSLYSRRQGGRLFKPQISLTWQISLFSVLANLAGSHVVIITTNYDTFLENQIKGFVKLIKRNVSIKIYHNYSPGISEDSHRGIQIHYLHGRVEHKSHSKSSVKMHQGSLVFSEQEYFKSRAKTRRWLERLTDTDTPPVVLIVGSSLLDPPLINWLQLNNQRRSSGDLKAFKSIVLQSLDPEPLSENSKNDDYWQDHLEITKARLNQIGIDYYIPFRCFSDVIAFLQDASIKVSIPPTRRLYGKGKLVGLRDIFNTWTKSASYALQEKECADKMHSLLGMAQKASRNLIDKILPLGYETHFKVELWLRGVTPALGNWTTLVKIADSTTFGFEPHSRRQESFKKRFPSRTSALHCLQMGTFELLTLADLGLPTNASRWQAFYAIPIMKSPKAAGGMTIAPIPIGSISLVFQLAGQADIEERNRFSEDMKKNAREINRGKKEALAVAEAKLRATLLGFVDDIFSTIESYSNLSSIRSI